MPKHMLMLEAMLIATTVAWVGWGTPQALAQRARVPQTGQTTCWQIGGGQISCDDPEGIGQDGDIQAGVAWPTPRFTNRNDGTVRDNLTGLLWLKDANCFEFLRTWHLALTDANTLASPNCGLTDGSHPGDWRLPSAKELLSLIDYSQAHPALPAGHPFTNVRFSVGSILPSYWTSTIDTGSTTFTPTCCTQAWTVSFSQGLIFGFGPGGFQAGVWPVKGGN
jgi:hypothetical protein